MIKKKPGNLLKTLEKSWKYHGILSVRKSGNPEHIKFYRIYRICRICKILFIVIFIFKINENSILQILQNL